MLLSSTFRSHSARLVRYATVRMVSNPLNITGKSGRVYVQGEILHRAENARERGTIFKAESGNQSFVLKRVSEHTYTESRALAAEFKGSSGLRMHTDSNDEERMLIFPFYKTNLLRFIQDEAPDLPLVERKKILRQVAKAIQELHAKDWIHLDIKADNILISWAHDETGGKTVTKVALGDFDDLFKVPTGAVMSSSRAMGNAMWRSPEAHAAVGMSKASDLYSFGLVCIFTLGYGNSLFLNDWLDLVAAGISAEQEVVTRHFCYFGPAPEALFSLVKDTEWNAAFTRDSKTAEEATSELPDLRFESWGERLGHSAKKMILGMTRLDPAARTTIEQVLKDKWWDEEV